MSVAGPVQIEPQADLAEAISALVLEAQQGNCSAFTRLVELLQPRLEKQALFLARHEAQARDLLQETLLQAWKNLHRYDGRAQFFTWVCAIMAHRHYDWLRRLRSRISTILIDQSHQLIPDGTELPDVSLRERERAELLRHSLDQLPAPQRLVVYLRFYTGESLEGIAALVPCSIGTVKSRLFHALQRLAKNPRLREIQYEQ